MPEISLRKEKEDRIENKGGAVRPPPPLVKPPARKISPETPNR
jgi:hypothetical protein